MIVGISGYAGSGKSTALKHLRLNLIDYRKFARPLKEMVATLLRCQGVDDETIERMLEGDLKEVPSEFLGGKTPRYVMQTLGTDWGRALIDEDLWVDAAMRTIDNRQLNIFDDARFQNEFDSIRERRGFVVRIERPGVGPVNDHVSEQAPDADFTIWNDGTPEELATKLRGLLR